MDALSPLSSSPRDDGDPAPGSDAVVRRVALGCDREEAWSLIATAEGLERWLGREVRLEPVAGGRLGLRDDGGALRIGQVVAVDEGRSLTFEWAEAGDAAARSTVSLTLDEGDDGTTQVTVEERASGGRVAACADAGAAWDDRLLALELDVVVAGPLGLVLAPAL